MKAHETTEDGYYWYFRPHHQAIIVCKQDVHFTTCGQNVRWQAMHMPGEFIGPIRYGVTDEPRTNMHLKVSEYRRVGLANMVICDLEMDALVAEYTYLKQRVEALEALRPHWAQGHSSDSIAAQTSAAALSQVWHALGVDNQTAAMKKLRALVRDARRRDREEWHDFPPE